MTRRAVVVVAHVGLDELIRRITSGDHRREMRRDELAEVAERRSGLFDEVADLMLDATAPPDQLVAAVVDHLDSP